MQPKIRAAIAAGGAALLVATGVGAGLASADTTTPVTLADAITAVEHAQGDLDQAREILLALQDGGTDPTDPPTTTTPPPVQDATATTTVLNDDQVRVDWVTTRTDVTGWTIGRDGIDDFGTGAWATELPGSAATFTFNSLVAGSAYNFTLTGHSVAGDLAPVVVTATPGVGTPPTTTPPSTTTPPPAGGDGATAAGLYGWPNLIPSMSDEFNYVGAPDPTKWYNPGSGAACWSGHSGNGKRCGDRSTVDGSKLVMTGLGNGDTGLIGQMQTRQYGRWEARVRSFNTGASGNEYHPLLLIWPASENWPGDGEYDFLENDRPGAPCAEAFIHYPHPNLPVQQEHAQEQNCGAPLSEWHNVAFEWAPDQVSGYVDGVEFFRFSGGAGPGGRSNIQSMPAGKLVIQFDNFFGAGMRDASYEVDWVRTYAL